MKQILEQIKGKKVLVLGDIMLDEYIYGEVTRISPEAPVPVVRVLHKTHTLGGAANVAANLAALGAWPTLIGTCKFDTGGMHVRDMLASLGIGFRLVESYKPTTLKTRVIGHQQQMLRIDEEDILPNSDATNELLISCIEDELAAQPCAIIISDYAKGVVNIATIDPIRYHGGRYKTPWIVDPKPIHQDLYIGATALTPNTNEMAGMGGHGPLSNEGLALIKKLDLSGLLITRGEHGMMLLTPEVHLIPTVAQEVFDVSGAGDTVISAFAAALGVGASWLDAATLANLAAGISVGKQGTATVSYNELNSRL